MKRRTTQPPAAPIPPAVLSFFSRRHRFSRDRGRRGTQETARATEVGHPCAARSAGTPGAFGQSASSPVAIDIFYLPSRRSSFLFSHPTFRGLDTLTRGFFLSLVRQILLPTLNDFSHPETPLCTYAQLIQIPRIFRESFRDLVRRVSQLTEKLGPSILKLREFFLDIFHQFFFEKEKL